MDYADERVKLAGDVVQSFMNISKILIKFTQKNAASLGLTSPQMGILNTISSAPGKTLKEISEKLFLSKSTISVSVDDLVNAGLVERKVSEEDRREINLYVTDKGRQLSKKSCDNALSYRAMVAALEKIPENDIRLLLGIHRELQANLKECQL